MAKVMEWEDVISVARQLGHKHRVSGSESHMRGEDVVLNVLSHIACKLQSVVTDDPIAMRLPCPACHELHIDEGEFATKPHHTHACQSCGAV